MQFLAGFFQKWFGGFGICVIMPNMSMSEEKTLTKDTRAIMIAIVMATIAIIGINKSDISELRGELRAEIRELRGLLISHISGHDHAAIVAEGESKKAAQ